MPGAVKLAEVVRTASEILPENAIVTNGAGNYAAFLHRYFEYKAYRTQLAPTSGSMGYGLPAAIAAKIAHPERAVVNFQGDGCFLMTGQELATAVQYGLPIVTIIANNGMYGTIRMHQEREYPAPRGRHHAGRTPTSPPTRAASGRKATPSRRRPTSRPALQRARLPATPAVIELKLDPEAISPRQTLTAIRERTRTGAVRRRERADGSCQSLSKIDPAFAESCAN